MEDEEKATLEHFMKNLYYAGFDVPTILAKGFEFAMRESDPMDLYPHKQLFYASLQVVEVARMMEIDRRAQVRAYKEAEQEMRWHR